MSHDIVKPPEDFEKDEWLIRPCEIYREEYKDCKSLKSRFNQYFIFGKYLECSQWKTDHENCVQWEATKEEKAKKDLILSEYEKRRVRLEPHYKNDIWRRRKEAPSDWAKPLPAWMVERDRNSYLDIKSRQLKGEDVHIIDKSTCTIM